MSLRESFGLFLRTNVNSLFSTVDFLFPSKHLKTTFENSTHRLITHIIKFSKNLDRRCRTLCVFLRVNQEMPHSQNLKRGQISFCCSCMPTSITLYMRTGIDRPPRIRRGVAKLLVILALFQLKYIKMQITACGDIDEILLAMKSIKVNQQHSSVVIFIMMEET